jgi:hypothetical protein
MHFWMGIGILWPKNEIHIFIFCLYIFDFVFSSQNISKKLFLKQNLFFLERGKNDVKNNPEFYVDIK